MASPAALCGFHVPAFPFQHLGCRRRAAFPSHRSKNKCLGVVYAQFEAEWWKREQDRWVREEQRWLREEARWLREEGRWRAHLHSLESQISSLTRQLQLLQRFPSSPSDLQDQISLPPDFQHQISLPTDLKDEITPPSSSFDQVSSTNTTTNPSYKNSNVSNNETKKRNSLKLGSQGEAVKEMQEALQRLGFYSGEDDMESSSFGGGTQSAVKSWQDDMESSSFDGGAQRAVKSWQATLGIIEDGTMTEELLAKLLGDEMLHTELDEKLSSGASVPLRQKDNINGSVRRPPVAETGKIKQVITDEIEVEISERRVYLLGENRWEEPQRLKNKQNVGSKVGTSARCFSCQGESKMICTECDGTGELNVEEQFLEWVEEAKCPYCEGFGYTLCDVCEGKGPKV